VALKVKQLLQRILGNEHAWDLRRHFSRHSDWRSIVADLPSSAFVTVSRSFYSRVRHGAALQDAMREKETYRDLNPCQQIVTLGLHEHRRSVILQGYISV